MGWLATLTTWIAVIMVIDGIAALFCAGWLQRMFPTFNVRALAVAEVVVGLLILAIKGLAVAM